LSKVLAALGFVRKETKNFTAYSEAAHDALVVLPNRSADSEVGAPHLVTVRNTITGKGITSSEELQSLLVGLVVKPRRSGSAARSRRLIQIGKTFRKPGVKKRPSPALGE